jgi:alpha-1,6-mannosyltransferase
VIVTVAGAGALQPLFESWRHPRLRYVGYVRDRKALAALYAGHDILLAPGRHETFGLAALEAAAAGLLVVGPDRGGTGALLREMASPFTFRADNVASFLASIRAALAADWRLASEAGRALAARYGTWADAVARLVRAYEALVEEGRCRT